MSKFSQSYSCVFGGMIWRFVTVCPSRILLCFSLFLVVSHLACCYSLSYARSCLLCGVVLRSLSRI